MEFVLVEKPTDTILPILESRLPKSSHSHNMVVMSPSFEKEMQIYVLNGEISDKSCIVIINHREDYAQEMNVSIPDKFEITDELKNLFASWSVFDWNKMYIISAVERSLTPMFVEISSFITGNAIGINPCYLYYIERGEASKLEIKETPNAVVKPLDETSGVEFLRRTWKYGMAGSEDYIRRMIGRNETSGVYVEDKVVCGMLVNGHGTMGMLYTDAEYRQKGYAKICIQSLMKKCVMNGIVPCSCCEVKNSVSAKFHENVGMKISHVVDFLLYNSSGF